MDGKKLVTLLMGIFIAGCLATWLATDSFPPVQETSFVVGMIVFSFVGATILNGAKKNDDGEDTDSSLPKKSYLLVAFSPWLAFLAIVTNAVADSSAASSHATTVMTRSTGHYRSNVNLASWESAGETNAIPVKKSCYDRLTPGRKVTVIERDGALGIQWIVGIAECSR